jgi:cell wall-associated NlpC family hydrolase
MRSSILYLLAFAGALGGCAGVAPQMREPAQAPVAQATPTTAQAEALLQALLALGIDYRYGGSSHELGFDCSGLVAHVFRQAYGIELPRTARAQSEAGVAVSVSELRAGDLVFYDTLGSPYSHVGIYLGDGTFLHAPKSGAKVRIEPMNSGYWRSRFNGARRIGPGT